MQGGGAYFIAFNEIIFASVQWRGRGDPGPGHRGQILDADLEAQRLC